MSNEELNPESGKDDEELEALQRRLQRTEFANDYLHDRNTELEQRLLQLQQLYRQRITQKELDLKQEKERNTKAQKDTRNALYWLSSAFLAFGTAFIFQFPDISNPQFLLGIILITISIAMFSFAFLKLK